MKKFRRLPKVKDIIHLLKSFDKHCTDSRLWVSTTMDCENSFVVYHGEVCFIIGEKDDYKISMGLSLWAGSILHFDSRFFRISYHNGRDINNGYNIDLIPFDSIGSYESIIYVKLKSKI